MQDTFARARTLLKDRYWPSTRATIGYLVDPKSSKDTVVILISDF